MLAKLHAMTDGRLPLIGVGGVAHAPSRPTPRSAPAPRRVQLYTALVYQGLGLVPRLLAGLDRLLARDGFATVAEAVGTGRREWLAG